MPRSIPRPSILDEFTDRTLKATDFHRDSDGIPGFVYRTKDGKEWQWVRHDVDFAKVKAPLWASMGCTRTRENLLFDANSPRLLHLRQQVIEQTIGKSPREVLETVNQIVDELSAVAGKTRDERDEEVSSLLREFLLRKADLNITIDELIEEKLLVCRHKALLVAYLLGDLERMGILPPGEVRHHRSDLRYRKDSPTALTERIGVHTWAIYFQHTGNKDLWICDPRWQAIRNLNNGLELTLASREYGTPTLLKMLESLKDKSGAVSPHFPTRDQAAISSPVAAPRPAAVVIPTRSTAVSPSPTPPTYTPLAATRAPTTMPGTGLNIVIEGPDSRCRSSRKP